MTDISMDQVSGPGASPTTALDDVAEARDRVAAAKRTHSAQLVEEAQRLLQAAVDAAREQHVPWGEIGSALGIARGNAYQRYRNRPSLGEFRGRLDATNAFRNPSL